MQDSNVNIIRVTPQDQSHVIIKETPAEEYYSELLYRVPQVSGKLVAHVHLM